MRTSALLATSLLPLAAAALASACGSDVVPSPSDCDAFEDDTTGSEVRLLVVNATDATVFLEPGPSCSGRQVAYALVGPEGEELPTELDVCEQTCADLVERGYVPCAADCAISSTPMLPPGSTYEILWRGSVFPVFEMATSCVEDETGDGNVSCAQRQRPEAGSYTVRFALFSSCTDAGGQACTCSPGVSGSCEIFDQTTLSGEGSVDVTFDLPTSEVEIRIE